MLNDFTTAATEDEVLIVAAAVVREVGDLLLAANRRWSGSGKWLLREMTSFDHERSTDYAAQLMTGLRATTQGNCTPMHNAVLAILDELGGPIFDGYHRGAP